MEFRRTRFPEVLLIDLKPRCDERGSFARIFCAEEFSRHGLCSHWVQQSVSRNPGIGTLRGLHFQKPPHAEIKYVRCSRGEIFDVVIDTRPDSSTYGEWQGFTLSESNHQGLYIPEGFAHGFITLAANSEVSYCMSEPYVPGHSVGFVWNDPNINISWPILPKVISHRDQSLPLLNDLNASIVSSTN